MKSPGKYYSSWMKTTNFQLKFFVNLWQESGRRKNKGINSSWVPCVRQLTYIILLNSHNSTKRQLFWVHHREVNKHKEIMWKAHRQKMMMIRDGGFTQTCFKAHPEPLWVFEKLLRHKGWGWISRLRKLSWAKFFILTSPTYPYRIKPAEKLLLCPTVLTFH